MQVQCVFLGEILWGRVFLWVFLWNFPWFSMVFYGFHGFSSIFLLVSLVFEGQFGEVKTDVLV